MIGKDYSDARIRCITLHYNSIITRRKQVKPYFILNTLNRHWNRGTDFSQIIIFLKYARHKAPVWHLTGKVSLSVSTVIFLTVEAEKGRFSYNSVKYLHHKVKCFLFTSSAFGLGYLPKKKKKIYLLIGGLLCPAESWQLFFNFCLFNDILLESPQNLKKE